MPPQTPTATPPAPDTSHNILASLLNGLPLVAAVTGVVGLVITALAASRLANELGFPTLLPTMLGNFEVSYALMLFILAVLAFSAPVSLFISDKDRELATFTSKSLGIFAVVSALSAISLYALTWGFPAQEEYWMTGFVFLTCGFLLPATSNNQPVKSSGSAAVIGNYLLRAFLFILFFFMCLISFFIPISHFVNWISGWVPNGPAPFHPGMAVILLGYCISASTFSVYYYKSSTRDPVGSLAGTNYYRRYSSVPSSDPASIWQTLAITTLLISSWVAIASLLADGEIQNGILDALNERVNVSLAPSTQKSLCGVTVPDASATTKYWLVNYSHGGTSYWACYTSANKFLWHGEMPAKQFVLAVWPSAGSMRSGAKANNQASEK